MTESVSLPSHNETKQALLNEASEAYDTSDINHNETNTSVLFVGDLANDVSEQEIFDMFSPFGEIVYVEIKKDKITKNSLRYGFVQFKEMADAITAREKLHKTELHNKPLRIGWAHKNTNLFVGDLDDTVTVQELINLFQKYGELIIEETYIKNKNYGFVKFAHRADAETAKKELNGFILGKRAIRIGWGYHNSNADLQKNCIHIKFNPAELLEPLVEHDILEIFQKHGEVKHISLPFRHHVEYDVTVSENSTGVNNKAKNGKYQVKNNPNINTNTVEDGEKDSPLSVQNLSVNSNDTSTTKQKESDNTSHSVPSESRTLKGYAFIYYNDTIDGENSAKNAKAQLDNSSLKGAVIKCNFGKRYKISNSHNRAHAPFFAPAQFYPHMNIMHVPNFSNSNNHGNANSGGKPQFYNPKFSNLRIADPNNRYPHNKNIVIGGNNKPSNTSSDDKNTNSDTNSDANSPNEKVLYTTYAPMYMFNPTHGYQRVFVPSSYYGNPYYYPYNYQPNLYMYPPNTNVGQSNDQQTSPTEDQAQSQTQQAQTQTHPHPHPHSQQHSQIPTQNHGAPSNQNQQIFVGQKNTMKTMGNNHHNRGNNNNNNTRGQSYRPRQGGHQNPRNLHHQNHHHHSNGNNGSNRHPRSHNNNRPAEIDAEE